MEVNIIYYPGAGGLKKRVFKRNDRVRRLSAVCPRSSVPFDIVSYYIKCVTTSWTQSSSISASIIDPKSIGVEGWGQDAMRRKI